MKKSETKFVERRDKEIDDTVEASYSSVHVCRFKFNFLTVKNLIFQ